MPTDGGAPLTDSTPARVHHSPLTCDALLSPVFTDNGIPAAGRPNESCQNAPPDRAAPRPRHLHQPALRIDVGLQIHHIVHWEHGGDTDPANLTTLCAACHRKHHLGHLGITGNPNDPDGVIFTDTHGRPLRRRSQPTAITSHPAGHTIPPADRRDPRPRRPLRRLPHATHHQLTDLATGALRHAVPELSAAGAGSLVRHLR